MNFTNITSFDGNETEVFDTSWSLSTPSQSTEEAFTTGPHNYYNHHDQIDYVAFIKFINTWVALILN